MDLRLRLAEEGDRGFIETLGKRVVMDSVSAMRKPNPPEVIENFDRLLGIVYRRDHVGVIAEESGTSVGFLLLLDSLPDEVTGEPQGFIAFMAVEPRHRGAGIGAALLARAEDEARRLGLPYMALMVTEENAPARALYEGAGYRTERRLLCKTL